MEPGTYEEAMEHILYLMNQHKTLKADADRLAKSASIFLKSEDGNDKDIFWNYHKHKAQLTQRLADDRKKWGK